MRAFHRSCLALAALSLSLAPAACSSSSGSPSPAPGPAGSADGSVGGASLDVQDAIFVNGATVGTGVVLTSYPGACDAIYASKHVPHGSRSVSLQLVAADAAGSGPVWKPVTFALGPASAKTNWFGAELTSVDGSCNDTSTAATGGTVTITAVSASQISGTYDLTFGSDELTGSFTAASCAAPDASSGDPTCS